MSRSHLHPTPPHLRAPYLRAPSRAAFLAIVAGCVLTLVLAGCGGARTAGGAASATEPRPVVVFAAASLTAAFQQIAATNPQLDVRFMFDGSPTLVEQLGARPDVADVLATADEVTMGKAAQAGLVAADQRLVATNTPVLIVPKGNPGRITGLDSSLAGKKLVVCAPAVPCGAAAWAVARNAGYDLRPVSEEQKVTDVLGKVTSGEADAGIVFSTDAKRAGDAVATLPLPGAERVVSRSVIALVTQARHPEAAAEFSRLVTGDTGRAVLASHGFTLP